MRKPAAFRSPAPSIDDPIELLLACHDKVRHFSALAVRLRDHVRQTPGEIDAQAREAATAILRYFDIAAPLHHQDEEKDLFPALKQAVESDLAHRAMADLHAEHEHLEQLWRSLTPWLQALSRGHAFPEPDGIEAFAQRQADHAQREEAQVYPLARHLHADQIKAIAAAMVKRRVSTD